MNTIFTWLPSHEPQDLLAELLVRHLSFGHYAPQEQKEINLRVSFCRELSSRREDIATFAIEKTCMKCLDLP